MAQRENSTISDAEDMLQDIYEIDRMSGEKLTKVKASTIRRMLTEHGFRTQWIAEQLNVPVETVDEFAAELRVRDCNLVPDPIIQLVRELNAAEPGSPDHVKLTEAVRKLAAEANAVLFRMASNRISVQTPPGAFDDMDLDVGGDIEGYEPVDFEIGLQGKKSPAG